MVLGREIEYVDNFGGIAPILLPMLIAGALQISKGIPHERGGEPPMIYGNEHKKAA